MSQLVRVTGSHPTLNVDEAYELVGDYRRHAMMSDAVRSVRIDEQPDGTIISHWEVNFRKGILVWSEYDEFDAANRTLRFRRRDGDPKSFDGAWTVREDDACSGCVISFEVHFDMGIPTMQRMLEPLAVRTLQENITQTLRAVFGDTVTITASAEDTTGVDPEEVLQRMQDAEPARNAANGGSAHSTARLPPAKVAGPPPPNLAVGTPSLADLFARIADSHGDRQAVADADGTISYAELDRRSNSVAASLLDRGIGAGDRVGLCVERNIWAAAALIGILKSGAAYVPLDPAYPGERLKLIAQDAGIRAVVGQAGAAAKLDLSGIELVGIEVPSEAAPEIDVTREMPAYVIYTSGSTGRPKGVVVTHGNVLALLNGTRDLFDFGRADRWSVFHSLNFDFSVWELWRAWFDGGCAVIAPAETVSSPIAFLRFLEQQQITVLNQTPSAFRYLVLAWEREHRRKLALRHVIFGGEAVDLATVARFARAYGAGRPEMTNMYGITEITVHATFKRLSEADWEPAVGSPIGRALPHLEIVVVGPGDEPVQPGDVGEMLIAGDGVAVGYLNRTELTEARFQALTIAGTERRFYRSGDLARVCDNGELEFAGRNDEQVKIRGFRVEPGEIEAVLRRHPAVGEATVVVASDPAGPALVAAVKPLRGIAVDELTSHCRNLLPAHMIPARIRIVDELPYTPSGKIDRRAVLKALGATNPPQAVTAPIVRAPTAPTARLPVPARKAFEVRDLPRTDDKAAGRLLGRMFVDDPAWRYMGPRWSSRHRKLVSTMFHRGEVAMCRRRPSWILGAYQHGRLIGVTIAFPYGEVPRPLKYWITRGAAFVTAGPMPGIRALMLEAALDEKHPTAPHVHCWLLASEPGSRGVGVVLLREILARADDLGRRCYLEATAPHLVSLYELMGFVLTDNLVMRNGDSLGLMWREVGAPGRAASTA